MSLVRHLLHEFLSKRLQRGPKINWIYARIQKQLGSESIFQDILSLNMILYIYKIPRGVAELYL